MRTLLRKTTRLYADALEHNEAELAKFVKLYALIGRMRVLSSPKIVETAQTVKVAKAIIETYQAPNKTFRDLQGVVNSDAIDPLLGFSEACRDELRIPRRYFRGGGFAV